MTKARTNADNVAGDISGVTAGTGLSGGGTSGTVTISADTAVVATTNNTLTMSGKTLTAPRFASGGEIDDANGNELIKFPATVASAINEITVTNATTSGTPSISATGDDTNISLNLVPKGTGTVQANSVEVATTSGTQTLTNKTIAATSNTLTGVINNTLLSTTGDLVYASSANTPARLGIGSSGQYLSVSGGIPSWTTLSAGGMTLLASNTNITGTTAIDLNSINQTYVDLYIYLIGLQNTNTGMSITMRLNNDSTNTNYYHNTYLNSGGTGSFQAAQNFPTLTLAGNILNPFGRSALNYFIRINRYSSTSSQSTFFSLDGIYTSNFQQTTGAWSANGGSSASNTAVTSVNFTTSQTLSAGSVFLYGVK